VQTASGAPKDWCERAREARAIASHMRDLQARCSMLEIAERYERKARRAEAKLASRCRRTPTRPRLAWIFGRGRRRLSR